MTNIQTPVTIYTNGNGCKWINDAEGEAVDFVTVADALNRTDDLKALVAENERIAIQVMHIKPDEAAQAAYEHRVKQAAAKIEEGV